MKSINIYTTHSPWKPEFSLSFFSCSLIKLITFITGKIRGLILAAFVISETAERK
ncbi:hypothetical protein SOJ16_002449 [Caldicellulosiruptor danielii]|uniref:Uncharacterized protein n=1 Tax=Anaerocellum danielii TaxID=1387557 RepID=A0ABZ0U1F3_9FIRM|nr:hypothetical protein [Caldicellulosiruptor danielii]WPX08553.1 hypothetical protein SOJ16_002449 [Caldicellulosiruptor danielii]